MMKLRVADIYIEVSYTLVCLAALCVVLNMFTGFVCCVFSVAVHECGHLAAMLHCKNPPEKVKISLFEIKIITRSRQLNSRWQNLFIIISGPLANFICFILFYLLYLTCGDFFAPLAAANLCTGLFNLLPATSLDGGQLLYVLLCARLSPQKAERLVNVCAAAVLVPLTALGLAVLFHSKYNFSLLFVCLYLAASLISRSNKFY